MKKIVCCVLALSLLLTACGALGGSAQQNAVSVYYLRKSSLQTNGELLTPVKLSLSNSEDSVQKVIAALSKTPSNDRLRSPVPKGVSITDAVLSDGMVSVGLSPAYLDAAPIDQAILKSCLTLTLCSIPHVRGISIHVGSETVEAQLTAEDVLLTNTVISAKKAQVRLYFPRADGKSLGSEYRTITVDEDNSAERRILEAILSGPEDTTLVRAFPVGIIVSSVYTQDGMCTVSLSGLSAGETGKTKTDGELAVYSVVDALTALAGIKSVQILIDGKQSSSLWGFDVSRPFVRGGDIS